MIRRKGILFGSTTAALVMIPASIALACVTFVGELTVDGHDGDTTVVGTGNQHAYCSTGRPTTAAAGHLTDSVTAHYGKGQCADAGAVADQKPQEGVYEVRYNNADTYDFDGTSWVMVPGSGCFRPANAATTTLLGTFTVGSNGKGTWTGQIVTAGAPVFHGPSDAANFCIGAPTLPPPPGATLAPGMLAPFRLLQV